VNQQIRKAQGGDPDAFRSLYEEHGGRVFALCLRLADDRRHAEELTQDVFVRLWEQLGSFRGESAFSTWLHRLAVNVVLGSRRSTGRRSQRVVSTDEPERYQAATRNEFPDLDLEAAMAGLPEGARAVFVLHDVEGYQHGEIAEMMGIATGTSKAQLHRARRLLREGMPR
jgi:RNA polymerase sigma-70 factor (ECF subfamily)